MKKVTLAFVAVLFATFAFAQDYKSSIGVRLGGGYYDLVGASFKTFISEPAALEFNVGFKPSLTYGVISDGVTNVSFSGAYQHHFDIEKVEGLKWYVGGGAVVANSFSDYSYYKGFSAGVFPTGGAEYKLKNAPFVFSADVRPTIHFVKSYGEINGFSPNGGVTARYTF